MRRITSSFTLTLTVHTVRAFLLPLDQLSSSIGSNGTELRGIVFGLCVFSSLSYFSAASVRCGVCWLVLFGVFFFGNTVGDPHTFACRSVATVASGDP